MCAPPHHLSCVPAMRTRRWVRVPDARSVDSIKVCLTHHYPSNATATYPKPTTHVTHETDWSMRRPAALRRMVSPGDAMTPCQYERARWPTSGANSRSGGAIVQTLSGRYNMCQSECQSNSHQLFDLGAVTAMGLTLQFNQPGIARIYT